MTPYRDVVCVVLFGIVFLLYMEMRDISMELTVKKKEEKVLRQFLAVLRHEMSILRKEMRDKTAFDKLTRDKVIKNEHNIGNIFGGLNSALVQSDLIMSHILMKDNLFANSTLFESKFLYKDVYLSKDRKLLSNTKFPTAIQGPGVEPLMKYEGVIADKSVSRQEELRINFIFKYNITNIFMSNYLIFDLSFCHNKNIDNFHYGGTKCFSMHADRKDENVHLMVEKMEKYLYISPALFPSTQGTKGTLGFSVYICGLTGTIMIRDLFSGKEIYTDNSIDFSEPLFVMFGVYNSYWVESMICLI